MTQKSEVMTRITCKTRCHGELTARRHLLPHLSKLKPGSLFDRSSSKLYVIEHAAGERRYLSTPSPVSPIRGAHCRTARMSSNICPCRIRLIFVLSLLALLCRSSFVAVAARPTFCGPLPLVVSTKNTRYFVKFNTSETICGNTSLLRINHTLENFCSTFLLRAERISPPKPEVHME